MRNLLTLSGNYGILLFADCMVGVAQVVECQTVDLVVVGSNPITHPWPHPRNTDMVFAPVAQLDRATDFESVGRRFDSCRTQFFGATGQRAYAALGCCDFPYVSGKRA